MCFVVGWCVAGGIDAVRDDRVGADVDVGVGFVAGGDDGVGLFEDPARDPRMVALCCRGEGNADLRTKELLECEGLECLVVAPGVEDAW